MSYLQMWPLVSNLAYLISMFFQKAKGQISISFGVFRDAENETHGGGNADVPIPLQSEQNRAS